ncbi:MAG: heme biosynthesis protein HemY, partial [Giesbergeria sp.]|nr:heme biosynthesis protein HemY [Giesbergeria sp.]
MRAALWLLVLFGMAVAIALFAGNNQGTVTLFWPPHRIDLSLNLVLLLLALGFVTLYAALRALNALLALPRRARRWRLHQKERTMHAAILDAMALFLAGRFLRSRKTALEALAQENGLAQA